MLFVLPIGGEGSRETRGWVGEVGGGGRWGVNEESSLHPAINTSIALPFPLSIVVSLAPFLPLFPISLPAVKISHNLSPQSLSTYPPCPQLRLLYPSAIPSAILCILSFRTSGSSENPPEDVAAASEAVAAIAVALISSWHSRGSNSSNSSSDSSRNGTNELEQNDRESTGKN